MSSRVALAVLLLAAALGVVALVALAWFYRSLLAPGTVAPEGGCGFLLVCGLLFAGFTGGALWLFQQED